MVTNKLIDRIKKIAKNENIGSIRKIHNTLKTKGINISSSSVHNVLKSEGLSSRLRGEKPFANAKNRLKRQRFANKYLKKGGKKIGDVLFFYDECKIECFSEQKRIWVEKGEKISPRRKPCHPPSIMVAGAINSQGKTKLYKISGTLNQTTYTEFLNKKMIPDCKKIDPSNTFIFLQDNAPCHKTKKLSNFFMWTKLIM